MKEKLLLKVWVLWTCLLILSAPNVLAQDFCNGDFCNDGDVDAEDVTEFLNHFGRSQYNNPCPPESVWKVMINGESVAWSNWGSNSNFAIHGTKVLDKQTGLIWMMLPEFTIREWRDAMVFCYQLNLDGTRGWRLPTVEELATLLEPLPELHPISYHPNGHYWTSTTYALNNDYAWYVHLSDDEVDYQAKSFIFGAYALCVRGGHGHDGY